MHRRPHRDGLPPRLRDRQGVPRPHRGAVLRGARQPRRAQRRLRALRGAHRAALAHPAHGRCQDRRPGLLRAGPGLRADRPRQVRVPARGVRAAGRLPDLHAAPPRAADPGHRPGAQHGARRRRPARGAAGVQRQPRALRPQARPLRLAARAPLRRQRRHLQLAAPAGQHQVVLQRRAHRGGPGSRGPQVPVPRGGGADRLRAVHRGVRQVHLPGPRRRRPDRLPPASRRRARGRRALPTRRRGRGGSPARTVRRARRRVRRRPGEAPGRRLGGARRPGRGDRGAAARRGGAAGGRRARGARRRARRAARGARRSARRPLGRARRRLSRAVPADERGARRGRDVRRVRHRGPAAAVRAARRSRHLSR